MAGGALGILHKHDYSKMRIGLKSIEKGSQRDSLQLRLKSQFNDNNKVLSSANYGSARTFENNGMFQSRTIKAVNKVRNKSIESEGDRVITQNESTPLFEPQLDFTGE